jgi:hypothetical protein
MTRRLFAVDFNALLERDLVALSFEDTKKDVTGETVALHEGLAVAVFEDDTFEGKVEYLFASGVAERNTTNEWPIVKWFCRIDSRGIRHEPNLTPDDNV